VEWLWGYRETDALGGPDPYSASKGAAEIAIRSYVKSYFPNARIFLILSILFYIFLHKTYFGKSIFAIGNNPEAAKYSGINVKKYTFI
jgi:ribose/xylose/arabinose/galactoside ABC-type transport system permease subunit